jgi:AcrR family transcriptional regulator
MGAGRDRERIDPGRSMRLLWRIERTPKRGPKQRLTIDDIVAAAIAIADEEGYEAISMRRVAERLGVGAMTLYTYVPAKSDLLDLMYDRVVGDHDLEYPEGSTWRERLELMARAEWTLYREHRWFAHMPWTRVPLGPNILDSYERAAAAISGIGLTGKEITEVLTLVSSYVRGAARLALDASTLPTVTAMDDGEWWSGVGPVLQSVWDPQRFPTLSSPEMAHAWDQEDESTSYFMSEAIASFEFGLARVLDGVEVLVDRRS